MSSAVGWRATTIGELGKYLNGRAFKSSEWGDVGRPIIRIQNLTGSGKTFNYFDGDVEDRFIVRPGDLLVSWAATLGAYFWTGPEAVLNQHIFKVQSSIDPRFHKYLLDYKLAELQRSAHGSGMVHITRGRFDSVEVAVPDLIEQRRIVDILEDHLSRLDAGVALLDRSAVRAASLVSRVMGDVAAGTELALGEVAAIQGGIQKQPKRRPHENIAPFLRVANVTATGLDLSDVHEIELFPGDESRFGLKPGDLLVVEGNGSASQVGRAALWDGSIEGAVHQNHLIRVRPSSELVPAYLEAVWNSPSNRHRLSVLSSSSSGLHTLSVGKLKSLTIPVPSLGEQAAAVGRVEMARVAADRLTRDVRIAQSRARALRRGLLAAAFSGKLTGEAADSDRIEELAGAL